MSTTPEEKRRTPLTTDAAGLSFFIQREGEKLPPQQFIRELILNGFQANADTVWIDYIEDEGRLLIRFTDNGDGMAEEQLRTHIKSLFLSGKTLGENHGLGARVATLSRNPDGVTWASRVGDEENMVKVIKDQNGIFALENWPLNEPQEDGSTTDDVVDPDEGMLCDALLAERNGTAVILHGDGENDTWESSGTSLITHILKRWWTLPGEVKIWDPSAKGGGCWRNIKSMKGFIEQNSVAYRTIDAHIEDVGFVRIHWALLKEGLSDWCGIRRGGVSALLENELFRWDSTPYRMMQFGITSRSVQNRLVIAVELTENVIDDVDGWRMTIGRDDIERTNARNTIDWNEIGKAFVEQMPEEISALLVAESSGTDYQKIIRRRFNDEWREIVEYLPRGDDKGSSNEQPSTKPGMFKTKGKRKRGPAINHGVTIEPKNTGQKRVAKEKQEEFDITVNSEPRYEFPEVKWTTSKVFGGLPGRAATYMRNGNLILMVEDHIFIQQAIVHAQREFPNVSAAVIETRVKTEFGMETTAKVLHINVLHRDKSFTKEDFNSLLSDDALTTALAGMHAIALRINKSLSATGR